MTRARLSTRSFPLAPWRELDHITNRFGRLMEGASPWRSDGKLGNWFPAVDVEESPEQLTLTAELPGLSLDDVEVEIENSVLTISGEKRSEEEWGSAERRFHVWERRYGSFRRSFALPRRVKAEGIDARFKDGVLRIRMPKADESKGRKITVRTEG